MLQETAARPSGCLQAQAEAEANGEDPVEAGHRAMFDPSKEASLARKYEAAAERGFFRALKEFRQAQRASSDVPTTAKSEAEATASRSPGCVLVFSPPRPRPRSPSSHHNTAGAPEIGLEASTHALQDSLLGLEPGLQRLRLDVTVRR